MGFATAMTTCCRAANSATLEEALPELESILREQIDDTES
jgi:hypothetical protein